MSKNIVMTIAALGIFAAGPGFAHARLQSSAPAADSSAAEAPHVLTLNFDEEVQLAGLKLSRGDTAIPLTWDKSARHRSTLDVALPPLAAGDYRVQWTALAVDDGHVTRGSFVFKVVDAKSGR